MICEFENCKHFDTRYCLFCKNRIVEDYYTPLYDCSVCGGKIIPGDHDFVCTNCGATIKINLF